MPNYVHRGLVRRYRTDFLVRLRSGDMLVWRPSAKTPTVTGRKAAA